MIGTAQSCNIGNAEYNISLNDIASFDWFKVFRHLVVCTI